MKQFTLYKLYMLLLDLAKYLVMLVLVILAMSLYNIILANAITTAVFVIFAIAAYYIYFLKYPVIKAKVGAYITQNAIKSYCNKKGYAYMYNVMIKNGKNTFHIGHIIITNKGIAVVETKFYEGSISGSELNSAWDYMIKYGYRKYKTSIQNPLKQNYDNIEALKKVINKNIEYYNIVLFIDSVDLSKCEVKNKFSKVGYTYQLDKILENLDSLSNKSIDSNDSYKIYNKIIDANILSKKEESAGKVKQNHV